MMSVVTLSHPSFPCGYCTDSLRKLQIFLFADCKVRFDRLHLRHSRKKCGRANQVADLPLCQPSDAIHERANFREPQI